MRVQSKALIAVIIGAIVLTMAIGTAAASRLRASSTDIDLIWRAGGTGKLSFEAAGNVISCDVTLLISLRSTIMKTEGRQGEITEAATANCTGETIVVLRETLPWSVEYRSFTGSLPRISKIRVAFIGLALRTTIVGSGCLFGTTAARPLFAEILLNERSVATELRVDETRSIPLGGGFLCSLAGQSHFLGNAEVKTRAGDSVTITLV
jgi:hypothetical protein